MYVQTYPKWSKSQEFGDVTNNAIWWKTEISVESWIYKSKSKCPKYDYEEVPEVHLQVENLIFVKYLSAHYTLQISGNQRFGI